MKIRKKRRKGLKTIREEVMRITMKNLRPGKLLRNCQHSIAGLAQIVTTATLRTKYQGISVSVVDLMSLNFRHLSYHILVVSTVKGKRMIIALTVDVSYSVIQVAVLLAILICLLRVTVEKKKRECLVNLLLEVNLLVRTNVGKYLIV